MKYSFLKIIIMMLISIALPFTALAGMESPESSAIPNQNGTGDFDIFLDAFMEEKLTELNIPGAAVVVVQDGEIAFEKGYGLADIDNRTPVDAAETVFRVGSISKLFTATAVMQLVERGELDLNTNVNEYLTAFEIPATYPEPITLHHLLTHTAGFEDQFISTSTEDADDYDSIEDYLVDSIPDRVTAPGEIHSYNNYGMTLAGYIVEVVSGVPFEDYISSNILQPLDMNSTSFEQPLPTGMREKLATGYEESGDDVSPASYEYALDVPASSLSSTVHDMAAFMIAHLQRDAAGVLAPASFELMQQQQFTHHPELPGMAYGFKERYINGQRVIGHGGDIFTYAAQMILVPEENLGFFIAYNRFSDALREDLITAFFDEFYPSDEVEEPNRLDLSEDELSRFTGTYRWVKYNHSGIGKVIALLPQYNLIVNSNDDGTLSLTFFGLDDDWKLAPTEPLVFKQVEGEPVEVDGVTIDPGETLAFRENEDGDITYAFISLQNVAAEKLEWYEGGVGTYAIMGTTGLVFLIIALLMLIGAGFNLVRRNRKELPGLNKLLRWNTLIISVLNIAFLAIMFLTFGEQLRFGIPVWYYIVLAIPMFTALLTLVLFILMLASWVRRRGSLWMSVAYLIVIANSVVFFWWLDYWNLLGYQF